MSRYPGLHAICALPAEAASLRPLGIPATVCGMGPAAAGQAAELALTRGATSILSWGVAGGLAPGLQSGDLVVPATVDDGGGRRWAAGRLDSWVQAIGIAPARTGSLLSVRIPVTDAADKRALWHATGCDAVDMESAAIAAACAARGVPFFSVRAIADPAGQSLPDWLPALIGHDGRPRLGLLARRLAREWQAIPALLDCLAGYRAGLATLRNTSVRLSSALRMAS